METTWSFDDGEAIEESHLVALLRSQDVDAMSTTVRPALADKTDVYMSFYAELLLSAETADKAAACSSSKATTGHLCPDGGTQPSTPTKVGANTSGAVASSSGRIAGGQADRAGPLPNFQSLGPAAGINWQAAGLPAGLPPRSPAVKRSFLTPQHSPRSSVPTSRPRLHAPPATVSAVHTAAGGGSAGSRLHALREMQSDVSMSPTRHRASEQGGMLAPNTHSTAAEQQSQYPHGHHDIEPEQQVRGNRDVDDVADILAERSLLSPQRMEHVPGNLPVRSLFGDDAPGPAQPLFGFGGGSRGASPARTASKQAYAPPSLSPLIASRLGLLGQHDAEQESEHSPHAQHGYVAMGLAALLKEARQSEQGHNNNGDVALGSSAAAALSSPMKSPSGSRRSLFR